MFFKYLNKLTPGSNSADISSVILKNESDIINENPEQFYVKKLLPIKNKLVILQQNNNSIRLKLFVILITIISLFNYDLALKLISHYVIPENEMKIRLTLNKLLLKNIF